MDSFFVAQVPDLSRWGTLGSGRQNTPRPYMSRTLDITLLRGTPEYANVVNGVARSIATARLDNHYLHLWDEATAGKGELSENDQLVLTQALSRGICSSGARRPGEVPQCNDDNFKGHLVEVMLFCLRVYLANRGNVHPHVFEPPRPKVNPATPGIDLLEVGETTNGFYFQIWECKGTDSDAGAALRHAAIQLCATDGTAYQGFMEAYCCLQMSDVLRSNDSLAQFISEMPRMFYAALTCPQ
jgi:hypothetical protein